MATHKTASDPLKVTSYLVQDSEDYRDVDTYVVMPTKEEWKFRVYLDKETGNVIDSDEVLYSPNDYAAFDETDKRPPPEVVAAFNNQRPTILALIQGATR